MDEKSFIFIKKFNKNISSNSLEKFIMFFIVFAYPFNKYKEIYVEENKLSDNYTNIPYIVKYIIEKNKIFLVIN